uniref:Uncharacterized protein n=1 Tax=Glossina austeni TaxID=7395 RepID=A0A1A9UX73_GLOAU
MTYQQLVFKHTFMFMQNSGKIIIKTTRKISIACKGSKNNIDSKTNKIVKNNDITKYLRYIKSRKRKAKESKNLEQVNNACINDHQLQASDDSFIYGGRMSIRGADYQFDLDRIDLVQYLIRNSNRATIVSTECQITLGKKGKQYKEWKTISVFWHINVSSIECCELKPINTQSAHVQMKVVIGRRLVPFSHMPLLRLYVKWNLIVVAPCGLLRLHGQARVDYRKENLKNV